MALKFDSLVTTMAQAIAVTVAVGIMAALNVFSVHTFLLCLVTAAVACVFMIGLYMCFGESNKITIRHSF